MDEQRFWEMAYCATASYPDTSSKTVADDAAMCANYADAALAEWRKRWGKAEAPALQVGDRVRYRGSDKFVTIIGPDKNPGWWMVQWNGEEGCHVEPADALIKEP